MTGKRDIVLEVAAELDGVTRRQAAEMLDRTFDAIQRRLAQGERVVIQGFGSFAISERPARRGRNPATGEPMTIGRRSAVRFRPGKQLRKAIKRASKLTPLRIRLTDLLNYECPSCGYRRSFRIEPDTTPACPRHGPVMRRA